MSPSAVAQHLGQIAEYSTPRAAFLYSSIASRKTANPTGYASAIQWWRTTLAGLVKHGLLGPDHLILVADEGLRENLRWERIGRPASLGPILAELAQSGDFVPLEAYLDPSEPASASWLSVLSRPLWWSLSHLRMSVVGSTESGEGWEEAEWTRRLGDYVVVEIVERAATALIPKLAGLHIDAISRLYTLPMLHAAIGTLCLPGVTLSERDCAVLARYLSSKNLCIVQGEVIKFAAPLVAAGPTPISESDHGILALRTSLASLEAYISSIEDRIAEQQALVLQYHSKKQLGLVKSHLVSRKRLEILLTDRVGSRDKVSEVLMGIERAVGSEETMAALTLGTTTLRTLLSSPTLSLDHIEATTTALADTLADADDINQAVDAGGVALPSDQEDDVERELREMVEAAEVEERKAKELDELREKEAAQAALEVAAAKADTASLTAREGSQPTAAPQKEREGEALPEVAPKAPSVVPVHEGRQAEPAQ